MINIRAVAWDFQQCGICDQQSLRSACTYVQSDLRLCWSLEYSMSVKLMTEHNLESKLKRILHMLICVYTCQNATLVHVKARKFHCKNILTLL